MTTAFFKTMAEDDVIQLFAHKLGLQKQKPEVQVGIVGMIGATMYARVVVEIFKAVPQDKYDDLHAMIEKRDYDTMAKFLEPYIPDFAAFVSDVAKMEYEATVELAKAKMASA